MQRIALPVDFSHRSEAAAAYASGLAEAFGGEIHALHIVPAETTVATVPEHGATVALPPQAGLESARQRLAEFVSAHLVSVRVHQHVLFGVPATDIALEAERMDAHLIVMGTDADGIARRLVFGSVSKSVLESAPCAVLLVPPAAAVA